MKIFLLGMQAVLKSSLADSNAPTKFIFTPTWFFPAEEAVALGRLVLERSELLGIVSSQDVDSRGQRFLPTDTLELNEYGVLLPHMLLNICQNPKIQPYICFRLETRPNAALIGFEYLMSWDGSFAGEPDVTVWAPLASMKSSDYLLQLESDIASFSSRHL